ncbi:RNA-binding S4 domain-containing protein [Myroides odoratimimus]|uniref:RNA-binding S4 domain-containing protein n=1 Tax=Myroides odoratimimus TaxID=76832 RepID=UPI001CE0AEFD|nr:RNA-binding S4 domain-containing protein [Myroides odoratimimus]MCA4793425.1 RNA-binding S4 domain-containing protein [Myroides odoratimimus]MCA4820686.1 RNA-binding S4 domain-containing protein [Myroides odoratimimus]MDM1507473.1 RNA-binding S4 domain-containing protein [Myroides odoratimimus]MDM1517885.1 RNA-binding S4 domain-containing protein [Myroides odoratimimus]
MRIDKYLWCIRYYKTRNIATEACKKGHITVNGQAAKASREVFPTDKITLRKDQITYKLTVLDIPANRVGAKLVDIYRKDETPAEALEHLELLKLSKDYYRAKGTGRPTKKDRRDIDDFHDYEDDDIIEGEDSIERDNSFKEREEDV